MKILWTAVLATITALALQVTAAAAQGAYQIRPGDTLRIEVIEDDALNREVLVAPDGRISFPLAGQIRAAGRTVGQVATQLTSALGPNFEARPTVYVAISSLAERPEPRVVAPRDPEPVTVDVYVMGEVANPGKIEVQPGTTVLQVFSMVGGFSDFAATKRIQLRRVQGENERIYPLNYEKIQSGQSPNGRARVAEGDTFIVPTRRLFE